MTNNTNNIANNIDMFETENYNSLKADFLESLPEEYRNCDNLINLLVYVNDTKDTESDTYLQLKQNLFNNGLSPSDSYYNLISFLAS